MKTTYMFVGSLPSHLIGVVDFTSFGQTAQLEDTIAQDAVHGGCTLLPASDPAAAAFTATELSQYAPFGTHQNATAEFLEKKRAAVVAAAEFAASCAVMTEEGQHVN